MLSSRANCESEGFSVYDGSLAETSASSRSRIARNNLAVERSPVSKRSEERGVRGDRRRIPIAWESPGTGVPFCSLSYVSHFDVFRQHVTRVFTNDAYAAAEACGRGTARTRTCTHIARETRVAREDATVASARHAYEEAMNFTSLRLRATTTTTTRTMRLLRVYNGPCLCPSERYVRPAYTRVHMRVPSVVYAQLEALNLPTKLAGRYLKSRALGIRSLIWPTRLFAPSFPRNCSNFLSFRVKSLLISSVLVTRSSSVLCDASFHSDSSRCPSQRLRRRPAETLT